MFDCLHFDFYSIAFSSIFCLLFVESLALASFLHCPLLPEVTANINTTPQICIDLCTPILVCSCAFGCNANVAVQFQFMSISTAVQHSSSSCWCIAFDKRAHHVLLLFMFVCMCYALTYILMCSHSALCSEAIFACCILRYNGREKKFAL